MKKKPSHNNTTTVSHEIAHEVMYDKESKGLLGIWVYIMSDCILFATLFATYAVLHGNTFGGPSAHELFSMPFVLIETLILLTSTFTYGLVTLHAHHATRIRNVLISMVLTFVLGVVFLGMEVTEFSKLIHEGNGPNRSAFLSAFFTLVGTHGLHVFVGLMWMISLFVQVWKRGLSPTLVRKLSALGLFWHFLDIIWIFIFTLVYLMGAL